MMILGQLRLQCPCSLHPKQMYVGRGPVDILLKERKLLPVLVTVSDLGFGKVAEGAGLAPLTIFLFPLISFPDSAGLSLPNTLLVICIRRQII